MGPIRDEIIAEGANGEMGIAIDLPQGRETFGNAFSGFMEEYLRIL